MKKTLLTLIFIVGLSTMSFAQNHNTIKYHGEIEAGYALGVGEDKGDRINVRTIQGFQIGEWLSTGIGVGADYYTAADGNILIPAFLNIKGYYPTYSGINPYISFNVGYSIGVGDVSDCDGIMWEPAIGVKLKWFKVEAGYSSQNIKYGKASTTYGGIQLKIGVMF